MAYRLRLPWAAFYPDPMKIQRISAVLLTLATTSLQVACGSEVESAPTEQPSEARPDSLLEPWERIPPDSLYGATAVENVTVVPVVLDVLGMPVEWDGMRIAVISDLQLGLWEENEAVAAEAVRRAVEEEPDIIVLLGDYIARGDDTDALRRVLDPLRGKNAFAVLGDRDIRTDSIEAAISGAIRASGVTLLQNSAGSITRNGATGGIVGLHPDLVNDPWATQEYVLAATGGGAATPLLITHHAPLVARAPENRYAAALAGNTVCGPVEVPGTPRLSWLSSQAVPGAAVPGAERLFMFDNTVTFITCGVGYSFLPTRLGGLPEVALVTLRSIEAAQQEPEPAVEDTSAAADSLLRSYTPGDTTQ